MQTATHLFGWKLATALFFLVMLPLAVRADDPVVEFEFMDEPAFVRAGSTFESNVRVTGLPRIGSTETFHSVNGGESRSDIGCGITDPNFNVIRVTVEVSENAWGWLTYWVAANDIRSEIRKLPVALELELDITGDAAIALLYPLGGPEYTVRYVPCCNIFGGITIATRLPVNPEQSKQGLPEKILSDFIVLEPDGLSASTMGMYMDFLLPVQFDGVAPALYEFNGREWVEFNTYEVDAARGYLSMHCPNGGTFVIAARP